MEGLSLRKLAKRCGVCLKTVVVPEGVSVAHLAMALRAVAAL